MRRLLVALGLLLVGLGGCVSQSRYDAAVRDANQAKAFAAQLSEQTGERILGDQVEITRLSAAISSSEKSMTERDQRLSEATVTQHNLQARLDEAVAINQQLRGELSRLGKNVDQLLSEKGTLTKSLDDMKSRLEALRRAEQAAEVRTATLQKLALQFKPLTDAGFVFVTMRDMQVVLVVPAEKLFEGNKAEISKATGEAVAKQIAIVLKTYPDRHFQVRAHTDAAAPHAKTFPTNWELSAARATELVKKLIAQGVSASKLSAAAYAEFDPIPPGPEAKASNRRVEIIFVPKSEELVATAPAR